MSKETQNTDILKFISKEILRLLLVIVLALTSALISRAYICEFSRVSGVSMQNTFVDGNMLFVNKIGKKFNYPKKGEIITILHEKGTTSKIPYCDQIPLLKNIIPMKDDVNYVKRVIALPGDEVDIKDSSVYLNGVKCIEPYAKGSTFPESPDINYPLKIEENTVFVLGDNREHSSDSRSFGAIKLEQIIGKVVLRLSPFGTYY